MQYVADTYIVLAARLPAVEWRLGATTGIPALLPRFGRLFAPAWACACAGVTGYFCLVVELVSSSHLCQLVTQTAAFTNMDFSFFHVSVNMEKLSSAQLLSYSAFIYSYILVTGKHSRSTNI